MSTTYRDLCHRLARNLKRLRDERELTLEGVADRARMHWRHIQKIEHGEVNPTLLSLSRLAGALDIDLRDLFMALTRVKRRQSPRRATSTRAAPTRATPRPKRRPVKAQPRGQRAR